MNEISLFLKNSADVIVAILEFIIILLTIIFKGDVLGGKWRCEAKRSSLQNYARLVIVTYLLTGTPVLLKILGGIFYNKFVQIIIGIFIYFFVGIGINVLQKRNRIFLSKNDKKIYEYAIINIILIISLFLYYGELISIFDGVNKAFPEGYVVFIIIEVIGLFTFDDKFKYQYKKMNIYLTSGGNIADIEIENVILRGKWAVIKKADCEIRVMQREIYKIEYFEKQYDEKKDVIIRAAKNKIDEGEDETMLSEFCYEKFKMITSNKKNKKCEYSDWKDEVEKKINGYDEMKLINKIKKIEILLEKDTVPVNAGTLSGYVKDIMQFYPIIFSAAISVFAIIYQQLGDSPMLNSELLNLLYVFCRVIFVFFCIFCGATIYEKISRINQQKIKSFYGNILPVLYEKLKEKMENSVE